MPTPRVIGFTRWVRVFAYAKPASPEEGLATLLYSLIEPAKLAGVEPRAYLAEADRRAIRNPGTVTLPRDIE